MSCITNGFYILELQFLMCTHIENKCLWKLKTTDMLQTAMWIVVKAI